MIDGRSFSFSKYSLPKTNSLIDTNQDCTVGYFDLVNVKKVTPDSKYDSVLDQLLMGYFNHTHKSINFPNEISEQNLFAFTNKSDIEFFSSNGYSFSEEKLEEFWNNEKTFNRFYSLMHIECSSAQEIYGVINWLNSIFNNSLEQKYNAVFYFSFDYSDIIVCAKNMNISEFTEKIFEVNYSQTKINLTDSYSYCIKDSFSIITFDKTFLSNAFKTIETHDKLKYPELEVLVKDEIKKIGYPYKNESLEIAYNIGVQNFDVFNKFLEELSNIQMDFNKYALLGRHDITINKSNIDIIWFIILLYYVDKYTTYAKENNTENEDLLFNCESFIRCNFDFSCETLINKNSNSHLLKLKRYAAARDSINHRIEKINCGFNNNNDNPITSVQKNSLISLYKSIESTLKNGFADDFVICLYEPFISLLDYLDKNNQVATSESLKEFDNVINRFFEIVSSLVNSAMHSDRQFIQTPSFNPVFFDVPPKLMAFYTTQTNIIKKIIGFNDQNNYSFIFKPSLNRNISVFPYSYNQAPPTDRLLAVSINEECLYHPTKVLKVLCHEASHFVGNDARCRDMRKLCWIKSVLFYSFELVLSYLNIDVKNDPELYSSLSKLILEIFQVIELDSEYKKTEGYSENIRQLIQHIFKLICSNDDIDKALNHFFITKYPNRNVSALKHQFKKNILILDEFVPMNNQIEMASNLTIAQEFCDSYKTLSNAYKESYADIQMILILNLSLEDYIKNFVQHEGMDYQHFINDISYYKIFPVVYTLIHLGIWTIPTDEYIDSQLSPDYIKILKLLNQYLAMQYTQAPINFTTGTMYDNTFEKLKNQIQISTADSQVYTKNPYITCSLIKYLVEVVNKTKENFLNSDIERDKKDLLSLKNSVFDFEDSVKAFYYIQKSNEEYLNNIIHENK